MQPARIAELLTPFTGSADGERLAANDLQSISIYIDLLLRWNARVNLTAVRNPEHIVTRHFGESLFAARHLFPHARVGTAAPGCLVERSSTSVHSSVADLGSGAGFPGIPIKLWAPDIALTLIESNHKKATFLREVARALTLTEVNVLSQRAETLSPASYDVVTLRAVERFESVLPLAASMVAPGGRLTLLISSPQLPTAQSILPSLTWKKPIPIPLSQSKLLAIASR